MNTESKEKELYETKKAFRNKKEYVKHFQNMIDIENMTKKESVEEEIDQDSDYGGVKILNNKEVIVNYPYIDRVKKEDDFVLIHRLKNQEDASVEGQMKEELNGYQFILELKHELDSRFIKLSKGKNFILKMKYDETTVKRMRSALKRMLKNQVPLPKEIIEKIIKITHQPKSATKTFIKKEKKSRKMLYNNLYNKNLNEEQKDAVFHSLNRNMSIIQGPPGTGKTVTIIEIIQQLQRVFPKESIMVCGPSNAAVDNVLSKYLDIYDTNLEAADPLRITSVALNDDDYPYFDLTPHAEVLQNMEDYPRLSRLFKELKKKKDERSLERYKRELDACQIKLIKKFGLHFCTCSSAGSYILKDTIVDTVIIDECTQGMEPEILIPILKASKRVILVGDHKQLGPNIEANEADELKISQFQRLIEKGEAYIMLKTQYRMHKKIAEFPSREFYENSLRHGSRSGPSKIIPYPNSEYPMLFYNVPHGRERRSKQTHSLRNDEEVRCVVKIVDMLVNRYKVSCSEIGVITPYLDQRLALEWHLQKYNKKNEMKVASVDGFQGGERNFIIFSTVRSRSNIGFLSNPRRLNVALTRAKHGLFIVGRIDTLETDPIWRKLVRHFVSNGCAIQNIRHTNRRIKYTKFV
mmetsp:Transcript_9220/g.13658  ORF Transcript_9220/g.13658 Transcript_9220/m.13658 type:complete len:637 (+) Transcript_9220:57-1967(+)